MQHLKAESMTVLDSARVLRSWIDQSSQLHIQRIEYFARSTVISNVSCAPTPAFTHVGNSAKEDAVSRTGSQRGTTLRF